MFKSSKFRLGKTGSDQRDPSDHAHVVTLAGHQPAPLTEIYALDDDRYLAPLAALVASLGSAVDTATHVLDNHRLLGLINADPRIALLGSFKGGQIHDRFDPDALLEQLRSAAVATGARALPTKAWDAVAQTMGRADLRCDGR